MAERTLRFSQRNPVDDSVIYEYITFDIPERPDTYHLIFTKNDGTILDAGEIICPDDYSANEYYLQFGRSDGYIFNTSTFETPYWYNISLRNVELENTSLDSTVTYPSDKIKKSKLTRAGFTFSLEFTNRIQTIECSTDDIHEGFKQTLSVIGTAFGYCTATVSLEDGYLQLTVSGDSYVEDGEWDAECGSYTNSVGYTFKKATVIFNQAYQYY